MTCIPENTQQSLGDYWKLDSMCKYKMPLGLHNFKLINAMQNTLLMTEKSKFHSFAFLFTSRGANLYLSHEFQICWGNFDDSMSAPQLKAFGLKHGGINFKSTAKKEKMVTQLQNSWPFTETLEGCTRAQSDFFFLLIFFFLLNLLTFFR
jgi:hypothetical protein